MAARLRRASRGARRPLSDARRARAPAAARAPRGGTARAPSCVSHCTVIMSDVRPRTSRRNGPCCATWQDVTPCQTAHPPRGGVKSDPPSVVDPQSVVAGRPVAMTPWLGSRCCAHSSVVARSWQGRGNVVERSWQGRGNVVERSWKGRGKVVGRSWSTGADCFRCRPPRANDRSRPAAARARAAPRAPGRLSCGIRSAAFVSAR